jgi:hypothetical protein
MAPDAALTSASPVHQVTDAPPSVHPVKQAPEAGSSQLRVISLPLPAPAAWLTHRHPARRTRRCTSISPSADVCAFGRLVIRVGAMTLAVVARLIYQTLLARMSAEH